MCIFIKNYYNKKTNKMHVYWQQMHAQDGIYYKYYLHNQKNHFRVFALWLKSNFVFWYVFYTFKYLFVERVSSFNILLLFITCVFLSRITMTDSVKYSILQTDFMFDGRKMHTVCNWKGKIFIYFFLYFWRETQTIFFFVTLLQSFTFTFIRIVI